MTPLSTLNVSCPPKRIWPAPVMLPLMSNVPIVVRLIVRNMSKLLVPLEVTWMVPVILMR